jgi:hypothetical protein
MNHPLVPTPIVDKNGVITTRNKKPQSASEIKKLLLPAATINSVGAGISDEQQAVYEQLIVAIEGASNNANKTRRIRIDSLHKYGKADYTLLFKTFLAVVANKEQLTFVEELHKVVLEAGVAEPHLLINDDTLRISANIMEDTGHYEIPLRRREGAGKVRDFIGYALASEEAELVEHIINMYKPETLDELKTIHAEYKKISTPLHDGVL